MVVSGYSRMISDALSMVSLKVVSSGAITVTDFLTSTHQNKDEQRTGTDFLVWGKHFFFLLGVFHVGGT
jgi:hypothetical protein